MRNLSFTLTSFPVHNNDLYWCAFSTRNTLLSPIAIRKLYLVFALITFTLIAHAQVGVGILQPSPVAELHINANDKGLVIPIVDDLLNVRVDTLTTDNINQTMGLLVYLRTERKFYSWNGSIWQCINPLNANEGSTQVTIANPYTTISGNFNGNINGTLTASGTNSFEGNGTIPVGGIIMWSGTNPPTGWAICNGQTVNGITTPNLSNRFVLASYPAGGGSPGNLSEGGTIVGDMGGAHTVILSETQVPLRPHDHNVHLLTSSSGEHVHPYQTHSDGSDTHGHMMRDAGGSSPHYNGGYHVTNDINGNASTVYDDYNGDRYTGDANIITSPSHQHAVNGNTSNQSITTVSAHENRPAYYVLAFIMRIQ